MARTTAQTPATTRQARALVRDLTGTPASAPEIVLDVRPAYDFFLSLAGEPDAELLPADREWLEASRA